MAHAHSKSNNDYANATVSATGDDQQKLAATFHDFLGTKGRNPSPAAGGGGRTSSEVSPSASASLGASSCGGRGPMSTTSDLGSERHAGSHLHGIPFYQSRGEFIGPETSNRFIGTKRSNSDSFMVSSKEKFPHARPESLESSHLMKEFSVQVQLLRHAGGERPRRPHDEETSFIMHQMRPISASLISQSSSGGNSKWDRPIPTNLGPSLQYHPHVGQVVPLGYQTPSNRFKDTNPGPSAISRTAADEGSRTGIKGSGILSSINATGGVSERYPAGVLIHTDKQKSGVYISEPESSATPSQHRIESTSCQMTIFYGGQAHVFDKVHRNKKWRLDQGSLFGFMYQGVRVSTLILDRKCTEAMEEHVYESPHNGRWKPREPPSDYDIIMALARSNGESWSTTYKPKSASDPPTGDNCISGDASIATLREVHKRTSDGGKSHHGFGSGSRSGGYRN